MRGNDDVAGMGGEQFPGGAAGVGPECAGDDARPRAPVGGIETRLPQMRRFDHLRVQVGHFVEWDRRVFLEEVHHFGGKGVGEFQSEGFDDGFRGAAMSAAGVGEEEKDVRYFYYFGFASRSGSATDGFAEVMVFARRLSSRRVSREGRPET